MSWLTGGQWPSAVGPSSGSPVDELEWALATAELTIYAKLEFEWLGNLYPVMPIAEGADTFTRALRTVSTDSNVPTDGLA